MKNKYTNLFLPVSCLITAATAIAQQRDADSKYARKDKREANGIGGREHNAEILGVKIGMDVPTALETVFNNANRQAGQENPDSKRAEGKDQKDIRVVYKNLPQGELQIVFANGKHVKKVVLKYARPPNVDDLRQPCTGFIGEHCVINANRPDFPISATDVVLRHANAENPMTEHTSTTSISVDFTDIQKNQRVWWRDEKKRRKISANKQ